MLFRSTEIPFCSTPIQFQLLKPQRNYKLTNKNTFFFFFFWGNPQIQFTKKLNVQIHESFGTQYTNTQRS